MVGNPGWWLVNDVARRAQERRKRVAGVQEPVLGADERLGEVDGILHDGNDGEEIAVANVVFGEGGFVAAREAVAAEPAFFQMGGGDFELVALPFAG